MKGWRVVRDAGGRVSYVTASSKVAGRYQEKVISRCSEMLRVENARADKWSKNHLRRVSQHWKNLYLVWLWRKRECDT